MVACLTALCLTALAPHTLAQNGPTCDTYTNKTTANGLGDNTVYGVYAVSGPNAATVFAATGGGLSLSTDGGNTFSNRTTTNGLGNNFVYGVYAVLEPNASTVYAATSGGLSISTDGGTSFTNKTSTTNGLGSNRVQGVYAVSGPNAATVYAATFGGLSISTDGGTSFTNKTIANGLGSNIVYGVYAVGSTVYAATNGGLSISTDGGTSFTNKTIANGLNSNFVRGVYAVSGPNAATVYAATFGGLSISTDGGTSFTTKTSTANGLGDNFVNGVYAVGSTVYAATSGGLSISTDGGTSFTTKTSTANGLGSNIVSGVYAVGSTVYAATSGGLSFCAATITAGAATGTATACVGTASTNQTFSVSGSSLTANITVTAPANFEVSTNATTGFGSTATLTQSGGTVANTTLYVRTTSAATAGSPSGNVVLTSAGATTRNVAVAATVTALSPDYQPLVDLYNATNGNGWTQKTGWLTGCTPCGWYGVTCDGTGRVTKLNLIANQLSGSMPASLSALTSLTNLDLTANQLSGSIPASLSVLTNLTNLGLNANRLSGSIPASLSVLTNLTNLALNANLLSGPIPTGLSALTNLQTLGLADNQLSGPIPAGLSALVNLTTLALSYNQLSGPIPAGLSALVNLTNLALGSNQLSGSIPASLGVLTKLTLLDLANNQLSGCYPASLTTWCSIGNKFFSGNSGLPDGGSAAGFAAFCASGGLSSNLNVSITGTPSLFLASGGSTQLTAAGADTYRWNTGQTTNPITVSVARPYSVTGTTTAGCSNTATVTVGALPTQILTVMPVATPSAILTTATTTLSAIAAGGIAPYTYRFSGPGTITPNGNTATVSGLPVGVQSFTVLVIDSDPFLNQKASQVVSVTVSAVPVVVLPPTALSLTASASPTTILTTGTTTLSASASGGTSPYSYSFSGPGTISQSGNTATVSGLPVGVQTFTVSVRDATAPTNQVVSQVVSVTVNAVPVVVPPPTALSLTVSASPTTILTSGTTTLLASASGGTPSYSYSFSGPGTIVQNGNSAIVSGLPVGVQTFTVSVRDAGSPTNQVVSQVVSVTVNAVPVVVPPPTALSLTASASPTTILASGSATLSASASGGTAPYSYSFSGPGTIVQNGNTATVSGLPVGVQTFTVSVRDATSPTNQLLSQIVSVTVTPVPTVPPVPVPFSATVVSYNCATGELVLGSVGSASGGVAVEYAIPGITNFTSTNTFTLNAGLRRDASQLTISVRQGGVSGASFVFNLRAFCTGGGQPTPTPPAPVPTGGLSATVVSYNCATGALVLGSVGGTGSAVSYAIPGVTNFTPTNVFTLNDGLRRDASQLTINVQQGGMAGTPFVFNLRSFCQSQASARLGVVAEPVSELTVRVLGNPASGDAVVEIGGAAGQSLSFRLVDLSGRLVESRVVGAAGAVERQVFDLRHAPSVLLLQVHGAGQSKTVKIVRE